MKFVCYKDKIIKALNSVVKGVASKTTMPILEGILIQTNDNEIKLTTYDLEIGIEYVMECDVKEQGSTVVNAIMFTEIIRRLPDTDISIEVNDKNLLVIECEGSLYKLATMNPDEFPELPKIEIENSISLEQSALKNMIQKHLPLSIEYNIETENIIHHVIELFKAINEEELALQYAQIEKQQNDFGKKKPTKVIKVGRNDPCPCGSGKKYKKCCGK